MRILIFSIAYEPLVGGAELAVRNITDRLLNYPPSRKASADTVNLEANPSEALAKEGDYHFDLITCRFFRHTPAFEKIGNVNVYRVGFGNRLGRYLYPLLAAYKANKLARQKPYQMVWSIMAAYAGAAALLFLRRHPQTKFLLTLQEGDPIPHIHEQVRGFRKVWQKIFKKADYIQAISRFLADWAKAEGATCPVEIVPNGVDIAKFQVPESRLKDGREFIITTVSRLAPKNGIDILIRAAAVLKTHIPYSIFHIQILGSGPEEKTLKTLAKDLGIAERVNFLGKVTQDEIPQFLSEADIFVRPSRSEGLGTAFLEAMAAGLPIIGTPVGGIPDFLTPLPAPPHKGEGKREEIPLPRWEGEGLPATGLSRRRLQAGEGDANGLFANTEDPSDLAEKIKVLMEASDLRKRLGENGRKLVEQKYDWNHIANKMDEIFKKLS